MSQIRQGIEIRPDGSKAYFDHFGDDLDAYLCRYFEDQPDEQPEDVEEMLQLVEAGDEPLIRDERFVTLVDLADDGTIILEDEDASNHDNGSAGEWENDVSSVD